jgi:hypothetical protein
MDGFDVPPFLKDFASRHDGGRLRQLPLACGLKKVPPRCGTFLDGYHLRVERDGARVRLVTKGGYDWTKRYP